MNRFILFASTIVFFAINLSAQNTTVSFGKMLPKSQMVADYQLLYNGLNTYHPVPFLFMPQAELKLFYENQLASFPDSLSEAEFLIISRKLITKIKCGHTFINAPADLNKAVLDNKPLLPFSIQLIGKKAVIANTIDSTFDFNIGDEVLALNGVPINQILAQMAEVQNRDGQTLAFVEYVTALKFRVLFHLLYGTTNNVTLTYKNQLQQVKETQVKTSVSKLKAMAEKPLPEQFKVIQENSWSLFALDTSQKLGYLKIATFGARKKFKGYYKQVFKELKASGTTKLIVDVRDNGGGYFLNGNKFLSYLTQEKFDFNLRRLDKKIKKNEHVQLDFWSKLTKFSFNIKPKKVKDDGWKTTTFTFKPAEHNFEGKVHLLTNGFTFSQASLAAAQLKEKGATVYGTETGGTENSTNCMINYILTLPNSKLKTTIPHFQALSNSTKGEFGQGIKPHYEIFPEVGSSSDNVLSEVINLISDSVENP